MLSDEQIEDLLEVGNPTDEEKRLIRLGWNAARKQDDLLIQQLVDALDEATTYTASAMWSPSMTNECKELVAKGRARLEGKA